MNNVRAGRTRTCVCQLHEFQTTKASMTSFAYVLQNFTTHTTWYNTIVTHKANLCTFWYDLPCLETTMNGQTTTAASDIPRREWCAYFILHHLFP